MPQNVNIDWAIQHLNKYQSTFPIRVKSKVSQASSVILTNIKLRLYNYGIDGDGKKMGVYKSDNYKAYRRRRGLIASHVTLRLTGNWYANLFLEWEGNDLFMKNKQSGKTNKLVGMYGDSILGFTTDEAENIQTKYIEDEIDKFNDSLQDVDAGFNINKK
jgi:hypothetical protein